MFAVKASNVTKYFKKHETETVYAVKNISFRELEGKIFGILGSNGSGKSTLTRMIATLLVPDESKVRIFGHDAWSE